MMAAGRMLFAVVWCACVIPIASEAAQNATPDELFAEQIMAPGLQRPSGHRR